MTNEKLKQTRQALEDCHRCQLSATRTNIVFGSGSPSSKWMLVGEAPGKNEDVQGLPFVGRAGELVTQLISESGWDRKDVYIANIVMCRPPGNRDPLPEEVTACKPFLFHQIQAINPVVITTLGKPAANLLLNNQDPMHKMRGKVVDFMGAKLIPTYHPSYIQRGNWAKLPMMRRDFGSALAILLAKGIFPPSWDT